MIEMEDMRSFAEVVEAGGFSRAAKRLGISKSIVSRRIAKLEKELGARLLSRTTHGVSATDAGLDFKARVDRILGEFDEAREAMAHQQDMLTINAVMQERERLSRELHDGVAQLVGHLLLRLDTIKDLVEADRRREAGTELERLREVADEIYDDIGESISGLRTNVAERGLVRALQDYVDQFEERHQIPVSLRADGLADQLPPGAALQLIRLVQEALTNVRKHAAAKEVTVTLSSDGSGQLQVVIVDDGQGFVPSAERNGNGRPLGLTSMRERVESLGGSFEVQSDPGSGTRVTVTIPLPSMRRENGHAAIATPVS